MYDPIQETIEEYLRRIHLIDKINEKWKNDQEENRKRIPKVD